MEKIIVVTTNHRKDGSKYYSLDICNKDTTQVFESVPISEDQANALILAKFPQEDCWE